MRQGGETPVCPACLIRLALEPNALEDLASSEREPSRLLGPVGSGPHGMVYLAYRPHDDPSFVTVKLLDATSEDPIDAERFCGRVRDLAERLGSLRRAGLPAFLEPGVTADGRLYVVAPYVPGSSIDTYLASRRRPPSERLAVAGRLCALVADLHLHEIIHGSLKSTNVIVTESRQGSFPVLLDVGVVPAIDHSRAPADNLAHEVSSADGKRRDIASLRVLLTELLGDSTHLDMDRAESAAALATILSSP